MTEITKENLEAAERQEKEMADVLVKSLMPLIQRVVEKRCQQWVHEIREGLQT